MEQLKEKITELLFETVSTQEQMILVYLEKNINTLANLSLTQIADNNFCSTTSVTRLVKKLGYNSFKELQLTLNLSEQTKTDSQLKNINTNFICALKEANCIYVYAKGASQISGLYIFRKLIKLGYDASYIEEQDLLYSLQGKTVLCISNTGETSTVYKVMSDIKDYNNCQILAITKYQSTLDEISHHSVAHNYSTYGNREEQQHLLQIINDISLCLWALYNLKRPLFSGLSIYLNNQIVN